MKSTLFSNPTLTRRAVFERGVIAAVACASAPLLFSLAACDDAVDPTKSVIIDMSNEIGAMNWLYAVAQLEEDFFDRTSVAPPGLLVTERTTLSQLSGMFFGQMSALRNLLGGRRITDVVLFRLGELVDYSSRSNMLMHAQSIEDVAAGVYAWVGSRVQSQQFREAVEPWIVMATQRANSIRSMQGHTPLAIAPLEPAAALKALESYYLTTFTLKNL